MFLFVKLSSWVSIQPLFRWNSKVPLPKYIFKRCFNTTIVSVEQALLLFLQILLERFNTTIVSVELSQKNPFQIVSFVSIQPLFRWNPKLMKYLMIHTKFQYNHCFGGTYAIILKKRSKKSFNTTIVSVELKTLNKS